MDTSQPLIMQMLNAQMGYLTDRQGVLAHNISNIDTPGYKAEDLKKLDFARMAESESQKLQMSTTSGKHLNGTTSTSGKFASERVRKPLEVTPQGNNVVLEDQMAKVSDTGAQFQLASTLAHKYTQLYHDALGKN